MQLSPGTKLAHYEILEPIGKGGMGEVYRAKDSKLGRDVAIKVLPEEFAENEERLARFKREGEAVAAVNHPNIVTVFSVEEHEGIHFITMELVRGNTLTELLPETGLELRHFFKIALALTDAASAAHRRGIIHRDLKPDNLMEDEEGWLKILDFGLVKWQQKVVGRGLSELSTALMTETGRVMGTVAYMSPEQAEGVRVDLRSDIFSIGTILYEMATGQRPFKGRSTTSILSSILRDTPAPVTELNPALPAILSEIIRRCHAKKPEDRYSSAKDVHDELAELKRDVESGGVVTGARMTDEATSLSPLSSDKDGASVPAPRRTLGAARVAVWLAVPAAIVAALVTWFLAPSSSEVTRQAVPLTTALGVETQPALSPNGNFVAFSAQSDPGATYDILVQNVDGGDPIRLTDSEPREHYPVWSPDGDEIVFLRESGEEKGVAWNQPGTLVIKPALGGRERTVTTVRATEWMTSHGIDWSPDGSTLALTDAQANGKQAIFLLSLETGEKTVLTKPPSDVIGDTSPSFSPDGKNLAFVRVSSGFGFGDLFVQSLQSSEARRVTSDSRYEIHQVAWTPDGRELLFVEGPGTGQLRRVPATGGEPQRVAVTGENILRFALSRAGERLVYAVDRTEVNLWRATGPAGGPPEPPQRWLGSTQVDWDPAFSPDGSRVAFQSTRTGYGEIWIAKADGSDPMQLTNVKEWCLNPAWSPDGSIVAFTGVVAGNVDVYLVESGGGMPRRFTDHPAEDDGPWFSRDGRFLYYTSKRSGEYETWKQPILGREPERITFDGVDLGFFWSEDGASFFFRREETIWNQAFGREPVRVLDGVNFQSWDLWDDQIVYERNSDDGEAFVEIYDPETGTSRRLGSLGDAAGTSFGFDVSPDGTAILFAREDRGGSDLMLVDGFR